jgi:pilus assembly protein CpaF
MIRVTIIRQGAEDESEVQEFNRGPISIGRAGQNDVVLANSRVSGTHARVVEGESGITLVDNNSTNGTFVNGTLARGPVLVEPGDAIEIGAFTLHFEYLPDEDGAGDEHAGHDHDHDHDHVHEHDADVVEDPDNELSPADLEEFAEPQEFEEPPDLLGEPEPLRDVSGTDLRSRADLMAEAVPVQREFIERSAPVAAAEFHERVPVTHPEFAAPPADFAPRPSGEFADLSRLARAAPTTGLRGAFDRTAARMAADPTAAANAEASALQFARAAVDLCCPDLDGRQRRQWAEWIAREVAGLGPLTDLLAEETVSEIFIHGADRIEVRRDGTRTRHSTRFSCDRALELALHRMIGRAPDDRHPTVDGVTAAGVTVHAVGKPLVHGGPVVLVSPPQPGPASLAELVGQGRISADGADVLAAALVRGENLLVCGPPGLDTGGWIAAIAAAAPPDQRTVVVHRGAVARTLTRGTIVLDGSRDMAAAVRSGLRVHPDCLVALDLGGREAADLCEAARRMSGSLIASVAAAAPEGALARVQALVSLAITADPAAIATHVTASFDHVLALRAAPGGGAQASSLVEIRHAHGGELVERLEAAS